MLNSDELLQNMHYLGIDNRYKIGINRQVLKLKVYYSYILAYWRDI